MLKSKNLFLGMVFVSCFLCSCVSTNFYEQTTQKFYQDEILLEEEFKFSELTETNEVVKVKEQSSSSLVTANVDGLNVIGHIVKSKDSSSDIVDISLYKKNTFIENRVYKVSNKKIKSTKKHYVDNPKNKEILPKFPDVELTHEISLKKKAVNRYFKDAFAVVIENGEVNLDDGKTQKNIVTVEKATVTSKTNGAYVAYTFLGKPFVILGATTWNILKCVGFACANFYGGWTTAEGNGFFWLMPDVEEAKKKSEEAKIKNQIAYPEYHKPFTNNRISIERVLGETESIVSDLNPDEMQVTSAETQIIDNTISVSKSAKADANATTSVIGWVGTIITVPVSVVTWILGAAAEIAYTISGKK